MSGLYSLYITQHSLGLFGKEGTYIHSSPSLLITPGRLRGILPSQPEGKLLPDDHSCCAVLPCGTDTQHCLDHRQMEERVSLKKNKV